ncbi:hypothetical protein ABZ686_23325 [Streptomyces sp. NPDC006992]|uniref:hypothetical protein n=1 Tax=Streptomyces sp. NPDC006992 TaxID=3155601 RepID=UPI0033EDC5C9
MDDTGRLCQALAVRLHAEAGTGPMERALARAADGVRLWVQDVPGGADADIAAARRERELSRPADPRTGPGLRAVLLRYADGAADLVVVAHRAVLADPCDLARALLGETVDPAVRAGDAAAEREARLRSALRDLDRRPAPEWGLGEAGAPTVRCRSP